MSLANTYTGDREGDALDRFYTPDHVAEQLAALLPNLRGTTSVEPFKGGGAFAKALAGRGSSVTTIDLDPAAEPDIVADALMYRDLGVSVDWCATNPPFSKGSELYAEACLGMARNVALLVPTARICNTGWDSLMRQMLVGYPLQTRVTFVGEGHPFPQPLTFLVLQRGFDNRGAWLFQPVRLLSEDAWRLGQTSTQTSLFGCHRRRP